MNGGVTITPNVKRSRTLIDASGNELDPKTKQIIKYNKPEYVPSKEEVERIINLPKEPVAIPAEVKSPDSNPLANMIQKKVEEAVAASLAKIDIGKMVEDAINKAFKLASNQLSIPYEWGGLWISFKDLPHFQLPEKTHPDNPELIKQLKDLHLIK